MAFSQNGYRAKDYSLIATYTVPGTSVRVSLRKGDASVVLLYVLKQFNDTVQPLRQSDTGGYNPRSIIGSEDDISNHASGTAFDARWRDHQIGRRGTFNSNQVKAIRKILAFCEGVVRWGGDYKGRKDEMHFEINGPLSKLERIANKIRNGGSHPPESKPVSPPTAVLKKGSHGPVVTLLQRRMNAVFPRYSKLKQDGDYGPKTEAVVKEFQRRTGLAPDGVVGPKTKAMLKRYGVVL